MVTPFAKAVMRASEDACVAEKSYTPPINRRPLGNSCIGTRFTAMRVSPPITRGSIVTPALPSGLYAAPPLSARTTTPSGALGFNFSGASTGSSLSPDGSESAAALVAIGKGVTLAVGLEVVVGRVGLPAAVVAVACAPDAVGLAVTVAEADAGVAVADPPVGVFEATSIAVAVIDAVAVSMGKALAAAEGVAVTAAVVVGICEAVGDAVAEAVGVEVAVGVGDAWTPCAETRGGGVPMPAIKPSQHPNSRLAMVAAHTSR